MDYYQTLGISKSASADEIKKAYRSLVMKYHPDRNIGDLDAEARFKQIQEAYNCLSNSTNKSHYDNGTTPRRRKAPKPPPPAPKKEEFFGNERGRSLQVKAEIELSDVYTGCVKDVKVSLQKSCNNCSGLGFSEWEACKKCSGSGKCFLKQHPFNIFITCPQCTGTGRSGKIKCEPCVGTGWVSNGEKIVKVQIPIGIDSGMQIRVPNEGEPGRSKPGDLQVVVMVKPHPLFKRLGSDLAVEVPVNYSEMVFGHNYVIPTPNGTKASFVLPPGTPSGTRFRMTNLGVPRMGGNGRGDMIATIVMDIPKSIDPELREILNTMMKYEDKHPTEKRQEFNKGLK